MVYQNNDDRGNSGDRPMYHGNWSCSKCGTPITELPFQPDPSREGTLLCRGCHRATRDERPRRNLGGDRGDRPQRPMVQGNWTCSECGGPITELPFEPRPGSEHTLKCRNCFRR